jgi:cytochrome-b5 reductase
MKVHGNDNKSTYQFIRKAETAERVAPRDITKDELRQHNTREDCWMSVEGMVYDCTEYIQYHPGGDKIMLGAGKEATSLYKKYHPWVNHAALIGKYYRGNLKP